MLRTFYLKAITFLLACLPVLLQSPLYAQVSKPDARSVGLGGSLVTQARDATAMFWNPATLSGLKDRAVLINIDDLFEFNFVAMNQFVPLLGTFAASLSRVPIDSSSVDRGSFAWGKNLNTWFSVGTSINVEKLHKGLYSSSGLGFFIGNSLVGTIERRWRTKEHTRLLDRLSLGFVVNNIPLGDNLFSTSAQFGAGYIFTTPGILVNMGYHLVKGTNSNHLGFGLELKHGVILFAGIEQLDIDRLGLGVGYQSDNLGVQVAYSAKVQELLLTLSARISPGPLAFASKHYQKGSTLFKARKYKKANQEFKKYIAYGSSGSRADSVRQLVYALDRRAARTQVVVDSLLALSKSLMAQGEQQYLHAALVLNRVVELAPGNPQAQRMLRVLERPINLFVKKCIEDGIHEFDANRYLAAKKQFKRAVIFDKNNGSAIYYLDSIEKISADMGEEHFYRGIGYYRQKKFKEASDEFRQATDYDSGSKEAQTYLERAMAKLNEQRIQIKRLLTEGKSLERQRKYVDATNKYLEVLKLDEQNPEAKNLLATLRPKINRYVSGKYGEALRYQQSGEFDRATGIFNRILSIDPSHSGARRNLAHLKNQQKEKASAFVLQGNAFRAQKRWRKAMEQYVLALEVDPENEKALKGKGELEKRLEVSGLIAQGRQETKAENYGQAVSIFQNIIELDPGNAVAKAELLRVKKRMNKLVEEYFNRGIDLYTLDKYQESIKVLNKVLELEPKHKGALDYIRQANERLVALKKLR